MADNVEMTIKTDVAGMFKRLSKRGEEQAAKIIQGAVVELFASIIIATPVDTGRLRGAWQLTTGQPSSTTGDPSKTKGSRYIQQNMPSDIFAGKIYLTNNLPYATTVEFGLYPGTGSDKTENGYSRGAKQGMVRINVSRFNTLLDVKARAMGV